jgi:hypothetical protein
MFAATHPSLARGVEALDERDDGALARAALAHQSDRQPGLHLEAEVFEDGHLRAGRITAG